METFRLSDLVEYRCIGFDSIVSGALMSDIDLTFFLRNTGTVSSWINTLLSLDVNFGDRTEQAVRDTGIPSLNLNDLFALGNCPLKRPVLNHLSLEEFKELNDMSLTILLYVVENDNWHPTVQEIVQNLGLDGLETKVCLHFINEVALEDNKTRKSAPIADRDRVRTKIAQMNKTTVRETGLFSLCVKINEGVWLTKQVLDELKLEDQGITIKTPQLLEINEQIFDLQSG